MLYVLTEEEMTSLRAGAEQERKLLLLDRLQKACTMAANHVPVVLPWANDKVPRPWGCILTGQAGNFGYCDGCPVKDICPHDKKRWSK